MPSHNFVFLSAVAFLGVGQDSFIVLEPTDDAKSLIVTGMQLIDLRGNILRDIALNWNTSQPYPRLAHPGFRAPLQLFYVRVRGRDSQNMTFYRLTPTPVRPGQPCEFLLQFVVA